MATRYLVDRDRPLTRRTELRVHGVGGAAPSEVLDDPHPVLVAGDGTAGFYRGADPAGEVEAYAWGGLTSARASRAVWLLFMPFALVNTAGWMLTPGPAGSRLARARQPLLRFLGLWSTVSFTAALATVGITLATVCGDTNCYTARWWLPFELPGDAGRNALIGLLLPGLWLLLAYSVAVRGAIRSRRRHDFRFSSAVGGANDTTARLADVGLWGATEAATTASRLHLAAGVAVPLLIVARVLWVAAEGQDRSAGVLPLIVAGAAAVIGAAGVGVVFDRHVRERNGQALLLTAFALAAAALAGLLAATGPGGELGGLDRTWEVAADIAWSVGLASDRTVWVLVLTGGVPALVALIAALWTGRSAGSRTRWAEPLVVATVGFVILGVGAIGTALAGLLAFGIDTSQVADEYGAAAVLFLAAVTLIVIVGAVRYAQLSRAARQEAAGLAAELESGAALASSHEGAAWLRTIGRFRRLQGQAGTWVANVVVVLVVPILAWVFWYAAVSGAALVLLISGRRVPDQAWYIGPEALSGFVRPAQLLVAFLPLAGLVLVIQSWRNPGFRRRIAMAWDVLTFWPIRYHPLAPRSYAGRVLPEVVTRIGRLVGGGPGHRVIVSGHSQGSVIAVAAVARLPREQRDQVALVTHGSPIGMLYARLFPAYFDQGQMREVRRAVGGRWINIYRATDPIGGPVFASGDADAETDVESPDPPTMVAVAGDPLPELRTHFDYEHDDAYRAAVSALWQQLDEAE